MKKILVLMMLVFAAHLVSAQETRVEPKTCIKVESGTTLDITGGDLILKSDVTGNASLIDPGCVTYSGGGEANNTTQYTSGQAFYKSGEENQTLVLKANSKVFKTGYCFFIKINQVASVFEIMGNEMKKG